eukprot:gene21118-28009_t
MQSSANFQLRGAQMRVVRPLRAVAPRSLARSGPCAIRAPRRNPTDLLQHPSSPRLRIIARAEPEFLTTLQEEEDFDTLGGAVGELTPTVIEDLKGCSIYLVGMMGSGKTTLGKMLANTLNYNFFDTDFLIEKAHDEMTCSEIFSEYGQDYFRTAETSVIKEISPYKKLVVATGGGSVIKPMNWSYMQQGIVVWLNGDVELLARRVAAEGVEKRPLIADGLEDASDPEKVLESAKTKLSTLLDDRTKYYENADIVVPLAGNGEDLVKGAPTAAVMLRLLRALDNKIKATKHEREEAQKFTIEGADSLNSMRTIESPALKRMKQQEEKA